MNLVPRDRLFDLDKIFDEFWTPESRGLSSENAFFAPRVDIHELDGHYEITAEIPGLKREEIDVTVNDGVLTISAEKNEEDKEEKEGKVIRRERRYGKFLRSFNLGSDVHEEDISGKFEDGVLTLSIPKMEEKSPIQKRIEIN